MHRRTLKFDTYDDVIADIERLESADPVQLGNWTLGRTCHHLAYYYRGSLEGYPKMLPWIVRKTFGRILLPRILKRGYMKTNGPTIPESRPTAVDEPAAIADAKALLERLKSVDRVHPSPLFDHLTVDQCRRLHLIHSAHHLSFLVPKQG